MPRACSATGDPGGSGAAALPGLPERLSLIHIFPDVATAGWAARNGASVVQLRLKEVTTAERVCVGREVIASVGDLAMIVMNDDVAAAEALGVTVHLGQGDPGVERATRAGIRFGRSAGTPEEARRAEAEGALYVGAGARCV